MTTTARAEADQRTRKQPEQIGRTLDCSAHPQGVLGTLRKRLELFLCQARNFSSNTAVFSASRQ
jgi:hypothetical protein